MITLRKDLPVLLLIKFGIQTRVSAIVLFTPFSHVLHVIIRKNKIFKTVFTDDFYVSGYMFDLSTCKCVLICGEAGWGLIAASLVLFFLSVTIVISL